MINRAILISVVLSFLIFSCDQIERIQPKTENLLALEQEYGIKKIPFSAVPASIQPIKFSSLDEARAFFLKRKYSKSKANSNIQTRSGNGITSYSNIEACVNPINRIYAQTLYTAGFFDSIIFTSFVNYNSCGAYFFSLGTISSTMTGATMGSSYSQTNYSANLTQTAISYTIYGTIDYYLIIEGGISLWSQNITMTGNFTNQLIGVNGGSTGGTVTPPNKR